jgi:hypothetical protein
MAWHRRRDGGECPGLRPLGGDRSRAASRRFSHHKKTRSTTPPARISQITGDSPSHAAAPGLGWTKPHVPERRTPYTIRPRPSADSTVRRHPAAHPHPRRCRPLRPSGLHPYGQPNPREENQAHPGVARVNFSRWNRAPAGQPGESAAAGGEAQGVSHMPRHLPRSGKVRGAAEARVRCRGNPGRDGRRRRSR